MKIDHRLPDNTLQSTCCVFADIGVDGELFAMDDQTAHDMVLHLSGVDVRDWNCKKQPQHSVPDFLYAGNLLEHDVCHGERLYQRHCTACLHDLSPHRSEDPNRDKLTQTHPVVATPLFAGAVDSASAIHRFQQVNGVSS